MGLNSNKFAIYRLDQGKNSVKLSTLFPGDRFSLSTSKTLYQKSGIQKGAFVGVWHLKSTRMYMLSKNCLVFPYND